MEDLYVILAIGAILALYFILNHISGRIEHRRNAELYQLNRNLVEDQKDLYKKNLELSKILLEQTGYKTLEKTDPDMGTLT